MSRFNEWQVACSTVVEAAKAWREAECRNRMIRLREPDEGDACVGDNHLVDCPVEVARGDLVFAVDKLLRIEEA